MKHKYLLILLLLIIYFLLFIQKGGTITVCSICLESFNSDDAIYACHKCKGHGFHKDCIERWLKVKNYCPVCKQICHNLSVKVIGKNLLHKIWYYRHKLSKENKLLILYLNKKLWQNVKKWNWKYQLPETIYYRYDMVATELEEIPEDLNKQLNDILNSMTYIYDMSDEIIHFFLQLGYAIQKTL